MRRNLYSMRKKKQKLQVVGVHLFELDQRFVPIKVWQRHISTRKLKEQTRGHYAECFI